MRALFFILAVSGVGALNFLVYNPMFGRSHVTFMGKLVDVLVDAGHNVTMIGPEIEASLGSYGTKKGDLIRIPQCKAAADFEDDFHNFVASAWKAKGFLEIVGSFHRIVDVWEQSCAATLDHPGLMERLRGQHFDAAFSEGVDYCGAVIFHLLGINKTATTMSTASAEGFFAVTGNPSFPSYVPSILSDTGEKMTFLERVLNTLPLFIVPHFMGYFTGPFETMTKERYGPQFPSMMSLLSRASMTFLNDEPLIEFPRPTTHNIVDIGGISVSGGPKHLNASWDAIFNLRPKTVLLSFGTVARSYLMPPEYKETIRDTFRKFPDVTFIWKYERPEDKISDGIENIVESTFVPQNDMLYDRRLSLFITHCGQGSTTESTTAGIPLIVIPVLGDQKRNAQVIKRIGSGVTLSKEMLNGTDALEVALREVLSNPKYTEKARQVGKMIRDKPFSARETFVRNMEFIAKYGPLRQLDHYGKQLNFFQYYLIDVFAFLMTVLLLVLLVIFFIARMIVRCALRRFVKVKVE